MLTKKIVSMLALAGILGLTQSAAIAASLEERIQNKKDIVIATEGTYAPFSYHDKSGKLTGYDVEVTRAVAKKLGVGAKFKETNWDAIMAGLKAGRFDMVANQVALTTPQRKSAFAKSEPYSYDGFGAVARDNFDKKITRLEDIKGLKAAQSLSSNYGEETKKAGAELVPVDGMAQALTLVKQKRADITVNSSLALLAFMKDHPDSGFKMVWSRNDGEDAGAGLVVNKQDEKALEPINKALKELKEEGVLKELGQKFFGKDISVR